MARKADKLRPYRVDYFDIPEMKGDRALVRSTIVRNVTAQCARDQVLYGIEAPPVLASGRIIIKAYRYYKNAPTKETYTAVEDLFTVNKAIEVMEVVEKFHDLMKVKNSVVPTVKVIDPGPSAWSGGLKIPIPPPTCPYGYTKEDEANGTMTTHTCDLHPTITLPDLPHFDLDTAAPILHPAPSAIVVEDYKFPDYPVVPTQPAVFDDSVLTHTGEPSVSWVEPPPDRLLQTDLPPLPTWIKVLMFSAVAVGAILIILAVLTCGH